MTQQEMKNNEDEEGKCGWLTAQKCTINYPKAYLGHATCEGTTIESTRNWISGRKFHETRK